MIEGTVANVWVSVESSRWRSAYSSLFRRGCASTNASGVHVEIEWSKCGRGILALPFLAWNERVVVAFQFVDLVFFILGFDFKLIRVRLRLNISGAFLGCRCLSFCLGLGLGFCLRFLLLAGLDDIAYLNSHSTAQKDVIPDLCVCI